MSTQDLALLVVEITAPAQTLFILIYGSGIWSKWWRSLIGRALFTKALGLALLLDVSLANQWWGPYPHMAEVGLAVLSLVMVGAYLQLTALLLDMRAGSHQRPYRSEGVEQ